MALITVPRLMSMVRHSPKKHTPDSLLPRLPEKRQRSPLKGTFRGRKIRGPSFFRHRLPAARDRTRKPSSPQPLSLHSCHLFSSSSLLSSALSFLAHRHKLTAGHRLFSGLQPAGPRRFFSVYLLSALFHLQRILVAAGMNVEEHIRGQFAIACHNEPHQRKMTCN